MSASARRVVSMASPRSMIRSGPIRRSGSAPRKKLRHTLISGTTARSWYTVAMPCSSASRGEANRTGLPWNSSSPASCWCAPASTLISVDLPAPLSPSTQVTCPGLTTVDTSRSATTLP